MFFELESLEMLDPADVEMREDDASHDDPWVDLALDEAAARDPETDVELAADEDFEVAGRTRAALQAGGKTVEDQSLAAAMEVIDRFHQYQRLRDRATGRSGGSPPPSSRAAHNPAPLAPATRRRT